MKSDERWIEVFKICSSQNLFVPNLSRFVELGFSLPGTSTEVERLFSVINSTWTDEKGQLTLPALEAILDVKFNSEISCLEFFKSNKSDKALLAKVSSSQKY